MAALEIELLGGYEARLCTGEALDLPTRKARLLLVRLALPPGATHGREQLAGLLWSDRGEAQARASLRQALAALRRAVRMAGQAPLHVVGETLRLDPDATEVDVSRFESLADSTAVDDWRRAAALYRGPLLDGFAVRDQPVEDWLSGERERLHQRQLRLLGDLLTHELAHGMAEHATATVGALLALDPMREDGHRALMQLYAEQGQRSRALQQYRLCAELLQRELGVAPEAKTEHLYETIRSPSSAPRAPSAGPVKPSLAVLPFTNLSGDPEQRYFSDGIAEDIIVQLSRFPTLVVIARNASFAYRDESGDATAVARGLGVHFVVEGSVRRAGRKVRINVQLVDGVTGHHIWAERYDRDLEDIFALQDEVTQTVAATLVGRLEVALRRYAKRKSPENLEAYDYVLRGNEHFNAFTRPDNELARQRYRQAIALDPDCARAHLGLAWAGLIAWTCHWSETPEELFASAFDAAKRALASDASDSLTHAILGEFYLFHREYEHAMIHLQRALALNPNDADAFGIMGFLLTCLGRPQEGIQHFKTAKRLNPYQPDWCMFCWRFGMAQYTAGAYEAAITCMKEIVTPINDVRGWLAASYALAGRPDEAQRTMTEFLHHAEGEMRAFPGHRLEAWNNHWKTFFPYRDKDDLKHLLDGLRRAGLS
ncbi:MAG TPA: BTAD domain-containing putative transcriptional regulator [Gammaproteobacteria bacterium]|nr:BTAD domain-containing putative transcriptional regulator [Gammaproteobacteria bacterium]